MDDTGGVNVYHSIQGGADTEPFELGPPKDRDLHIGDLPPLNRATTTTKIAVPACTMLVLGALTAIFVTVGKNRMHQLQVHTSTGKVQGARHGEADVWLGVPYAQTRARFLAPTAPARWKDTRYATSVGAPCPQVNLFGKRPWSVLLPVKGYPMIKRMTLHSYPYHLHSYPRRLRSV